MSAEEIWSAPLRPSSAQRGLRAPMMGNPGESHNGPIVATSVQAMNACLHHLTGSQLIAYPPGLRQILYGHRAFVCSAGVHI